MLEDTNTLIERYVLACLDGCFATALFLEPYLPEVEVDAVHSDGEDRAFAAGEIVSDG